MSHRFIVAIDSHATVGTLSRNNGSDLLILKIESFRCSRDIRSSHPLLGTRSLAGGARSSWAKIFRSLHNVVSV